MTRSASIALLATLVLPSLSQASEESDRLMKEGRAHLTAQRFEPALKSFDEAIRAEPAAKDAHFMRAMALNRLGRFKEAHKTLRYCMHLRVLHQELYFELGWTYLGIDDYDRAIRNLEIYERRLPGRGQTSEFLGRAHFHKGNLDRARELLAQAIRRDANLRPTVEYYLARIDEKQGRPKEARDRLRLVVEQYLDSPFARELARRIGGTRAKPWQLVVSAGIGYDSNVIALGEGQPLPINISSKDSAQFSFGADFSYRWTLDSESSVDAGYSLAGVAYEGGLSEFFQIDHYLYGRYRRKITDVVTATLRLADQFSQFDGRGFRNQVTLRPALEWRQATNALAEFAYTAGFNAYLFDATVPAQDRDGTSHTLSLLQHVACRKGAVRFRAGYSHEFNNADGGDYDFDSGAFVIGTNMRLPAELRLDLSFRYTAFDYDNPNSNNGFTAARDDDLSQVSVYLSRRVDARTTIYFRFDYTNNSSNIAVFDYDREVFRFGVILRF